MTSAPEAWRIRRMMLMDASWPSKSEAAVTKRMLWLGRYTPSLIVPSDCCVCIDTPDLTLLGGSPVNSDTPVQPRWRRGSIRLCDAGKIVKVARVRFVHTRGIFNYERRSPCGDGKSHSHPVILVCCDRCRLEL